MKGLTFPDVPVLRGKRVTFLLGTDQHIGAGIDPDGNPKKAEARVGLLPEQVRTLREWLEKAGIALDFYFVHGAGIRSGIPDIAYMNEGGRMVFEHQLPTMPEPDLVHALKEPSSYESLIPGRFNRIGALHPGAISKESGVGLLLKKRNFAAIFDGGSIGTDRFIPIRGAMSVFAGQIAAEFCLETLLKKNIVPKKIVISGGGIAGRAALGKIISGCDHSVKTIIIDPSAETCSTLRQIYPENVEVIQDSIIGDSISDADAVILTAFVRGRPAPDVLEIGNISGMKRDSVIVDVSIDEKGGIWIPRYDKSRENLSDVVLRMRSEIDKMGKGITYLADDHLPKNRPLQASEIHGRAILPYIATLLYCSADQGGPENLAKYIKRGEFEKSKQMTEILGHLRRGLAFFNPSTIMYNNSILERGFQDPFKDALDTEPF